MPMVAFKPGVTAVLLAAAVVLALPQLCAMVKGTRLSEVTSPLFIALTVTLISWLISTWLSIYPQKALIKWLATTGLVWICFYLARFLRDEGLVETFGKYLLSASLFTGLVYAAHYFTAQVEVDLIKNGVCEPSGGLYHRDWRHGESHCFLPGFKSLLYPLSYVSLTPILLTVAGAVAMKYRSCRLPALLTALLFVFQALLIQQKVLALFAVGILLFIPLFHFIRGFKPPKRLKILNYGLSGIGALMLAAAGLIGNAVGDRGDELKIPLTYDTPRLIVWQLSLKQALTRPFFGSGPNTSDYVMVNGEPRKSGDIYPNWWDFTVRDRGYFPTYNIDDVEFVRNGHDLVMFFPPVAADSAFRRPKAIINNQFQTEKIKFFTFSRGEYSFAEIKSRLKEPIIGISDKGFLTISKDPSEMHPGDRAADNVLLGNRVADIFTMPEGVSRVYSEAGSDLLKIKKGNRAILMDVFADHNAPRTCFSFQNSTNCVQLGKEGDEDTVYFTDHDAARLSFKMTWNGDLEIIEDAGGGVLVTVEGYATRFKQRAVSGYFRDRAGKYLPATCGMYLPADGKPNWDKNAECPLPAVAVGQGTYNVWTAHRDKYYNFTTGIGQTHPHNWFFELLVDTGFLGTAAALIALMLWFRHWLMHPSIWAWLPATLGFIWWLEALVNFSFWLNWWQLFFLIPVAFASAWVRVYKDDERLWTPKPK